MRKSPKQQLHLLLPLWLLFQAARVVWAQQAPPANLEEPLVTQLQQKNHSVDACVDFYEFACGNWRAQSGLSNSVVEELDVDYNRRLAEQLQSLNSSAKVPRFVNLLANFHTSCERGGNRSQILGDLQRISESRLEWPQRKHYYDWQRLLALGLSFGLDGILLDCKVEQVEDNSQRWLLKVQPPWPGQLKQVNPANLIFSGNFYVLTQREFRRHHRLLWALDDWPAQGLWPQVRDFEQALLQLINRAADQEDDDYSRLDLPIDMYLLNEVPQHWLRRTLRALLLNVGVSATELTVQLRQPAYLMELQRLLAAQNSQFLGRYLLLRLLHHVDLLRPRPYYPTACVEHMRLLLTPAADFFWLQQHQQQRREAGETLRQDFDALRSEFNRTLAANRNEFEEETLGYLQAKLDNMQLQLSVLPPQQLELLQPQLEDFYDRLHFTPSDYYGNLLQALQHAMYAKYQLLLPRSIKNKQMAQVYVPQEESFGSFASPFFLPSSNKVVVPLSLLGAPMYRPGQSDHFSLSFLLAHELSHGFGPSDVHYNAAGNRAEEAEQQRLLENGRFAHQLRCLREQHAETANEKFADSNGLALAYAAHFAPRKDDEDPSSAKARTHAEQRFFINLVQFFCESSDAHANGSEHGSNPERVNGAVMNFQPFQYAFACNSSQEYPGSRSASCSLY